MINTLGNIFKVTSFGESHGELVGCVIDGCKVGISINLDAIQHQVNRRQTNQSDFSSTRQEKDIVKIVSGLFEGKTTGAPICILIQNSDQRSGDYDALKDIYRPNHADFTYQQKYGFRDHRGGGRSSVRITAPMVAAGDIARQLLSSETKIKTTAYVSQIGPIGLDRHHDDRSLTFSSIDESVVRCPDPLKAKEMEDYILQIAEDGDTLGGIIRCVIKGMPIGLGEPIFGKLQAQLSHAMMSINTVKGFEYGDGFEAALKKGSEHNDSFEIKDKQIVTASNHSGGIQGGISNGMDIYFNVAFKPISSIRQTQQSVNLAGDKVSFKVDGRHDVCAIPRAVPIVEAYTQIVLADLLMYSKCSK